MLDRSVEEFCRWLDTCGGRFAYVNQASHQGGPALADLPDFDAHQGVYLSLGQRTGALLGIFVHRVHRGPGAGGVRFWSYSTLGDYLKDGLRLARGMTRKNALAQLWWGGGKGVVARPQGEFSRRDLFLDYGDFVSQLNGVYVTAEDVGTTPEDIATIFERTRFTTCIPAEFGGSGNPSGPTSRGVFAGLEALADHLGLEGLQGVSVAVQGLGQVGSRLVRLLTEAGARVTACDLDPDLCRQVAQRTGASTFVSADDRLLELQADLLSPCALGGTLNPTSIPKLKVRGICGAANNQLEDNLRDGQALAARGIAYVPDFLTNRMGIVNCADEQFGRLRHDPALERHLNKDWEHGIYRASRRVLEKAQSRGVSTVSIAQEVADKAALEEHPIWGDRFVRIAEENFQLFT